MEGVPRVLHNRYRDGDSPAGTWCLALVSGTAKQEREGADGGCGDVAAGEAEGARYGRGTDAAAKRTCAV